MRHGSALALKKTRQKTARAHNHIIYAPDIHYDLRSFRAIRHLVLRVHFSRLGLTQAPQDLQGLKDVSRIPFLSC